MARTKATKRRVTGTLTWSGFGLRWLAAFLLVFLTYNPTGWSYFHWVVRMEEGDIPLKLLSGFVLLAGYVIYFRATSRSLGRAGSVLVLVIFGLLLWLLLDSGLVPRDSRVLMWIGMVILATFLAIGMTGSFIWRRLTGQYHVADEEMDEGPG